VATRNAIEPVFAGNVPTPVAGLVQTIVEEEELAVAAALAGDRGKLVQAIQLSPVLADKDCASQLAAALLEATSAWLPQFGRLP
jgi:alpha-galactosidase